MIANLAPVMPVLMPAAMLSTVPVLFMSFGTAATIFYSTLAGLGFYVVALAITLTVEVPIDNRIRTWTIGSLPTCTRSLAAAIRT
jgi:hypothetical protein